MNKYRKKTKMSFLIMGLCVFLFSVNVVSADEAILKISREEVGELASVYSPAVKSIRSNRRNLLIDYEDLKTTVEGLEALHDILPQYKNLYNAYLAVGSIENYQAYLQEAAKGIMGDEEAAKNAAAMLIDEEGNSTPLATEVGNEDNMQLDEYMEYIGLQTQFSMLGITNPNLTSEEEYERFIYPINVAPVAMKTGIMNLEVTKDTVKASVNNGAMNLYDSILMLEGYLELQTKSYEMSQSDLVKATKKYQKGLVSKDDYNIAMNNEKIAKLNMESMARKVENLKMNLNLMIGSDITTEVMLTSKQGDVVTLKSIDYYTRRAIDERNEIISLLNNYDSKAKEFEYVKIYFDESSDSYKTTEEELEELGLQSEQLEQKIKKEIREVYLNVLEKEENLELTKLIKADSIRQYDDMKLYVELGFTTESALMGLNIMVTQKSNDYFTAQRDYFSAVTALESSSNIGPAYSGSEGGGQFE